MTTKTVKRYRLAKPGDEGRECWVSDKSKEHAIEQGSPSYAPPLKVDGFYKETPVFLRNDGVLVKWKFTVVADDAPSPGEGYRLLKKLEYDGEDEEVKEGDEWWDALSQKWLTSFRYHTDQKTQQRHHYRRRIESDKSNTPQKTNHAHLIQIWNNGVVVHEFIVEKIYTLGFQISDIVSSEVTE